MIKIHGLHKSGTTFFDTYQFLLNRLNCEIVKNITLIRGLAESYDENTKYVIHIRNPIDLLISAYYSFGYTHKYDGTYTYEQFVEQQKFIRNIGIDAYCIEYFEKTILPLHIELFKWLDQHHDKPNVYISSYEKMKTHFHDYNKELGNFIGLENEMIDQFYKRLNSQNTFKPVDNEDIINGKIKTHYRNGGTKQYLTDLKPDTSQYLIDKFNTHLPEKYKIYSEFIV